MAVLLTTSSNRWREAVAGRLVALLAVTVFAPVSVADVDYEFGGHLKTRASVQSFADDSVINDLTGDTGEDLTAELRLLFRASRGAWDVHADYQFIPLYGDRVEYTRFLQETAPGFEELFGRLPNDDRRWFDLTHVYEDEGKRVVLNRLDRLYLAHTSASTAIRFGRQALTWGNGLVYTPMDIVNPFDPTQVDTEYKAGDDMLYGQYLRADGDDVQGTVVVRRNPLNDEVEADQATLALKYHGFTTGSEFDLLAARHYGDPVVGVGGNHEIGGAVWRGDLVLSLTGDEDAIAQFVTSLSYSWVWGGKNISGWLEYYFNGFGQSDGCYSPACLADNPELVKRLGRRQLFTLGRHYMAASATVEITPLFLLTPNLFWNVGDGSALIQIVTQNSLDDNLVLLGALSIPVGPNGTEYGGIETDAPGKFFSTGPGLFLQLGWYF